MPRPRSRTELREEFIRLRKILIGLQDRVDMTMRILYREAGWSRVHRKGRRYGR